MSEKRIKERCKREDIALKVVRGFLEKDCDEDTELYYSLETVLNLIDNQQKELEEQKEKNKELKIKIMMSQNQVLGQQTYNEYCK